MTDRDQFAERRKGLEEEYFRRKEAELIAKLRQRGEEATQRKAMAAASSIADEGVLTTLLDLGYTPDTVRLLHLVPLVHVAWMSDDVSADERKMILEAASLNGIAPGTEAYRQLNSWFEHRPSNEFFEQTLRVIRHVLGTLPQGEQDSRRGSLLDYCLRVAEASGGILGIGRKVDAAERDLLNRIATGLQRSGGDAVQDMIGKK